MLIFQSYILCLNKVDLWKLSIMKPGYAAYSTDQTQLNTRVNPNETRSLLSVLTQGLLGVCFFENCINVGFTFGPLGVYFGLTRDQFLGSTLRTKA